MNFFFGKSSEQDKKTSNANTDDNFKNTNKVLNNNARFSQNKNISSSSSITRSNSLSILNPTPNPTILDETPIKQVQYKSHDDGVIHINTNRKYQYVKPQTTDNVIVYYNATKPYQSPISKGNNSFNQELSTSHINYQSPNVSNKVDTIKGLDYSDSLDEKKTSPNQNTFKVEYNTDGSDNDSDKQNEDTYRISHT